MDKTDRTIILMLSQDSRVHCTDIASELGVATSTVHKRVNQMYNEGVIERFTLILNPEKTGTSMTTFIGINVESGHKEDIVSTLKSLTNVLEIYELLEPYDIFIKVRTKDITELKENVLRVIMGMNGVLNTNSILTTRRHKETSCIMPDIEK
jgi:Lrp/AsnC family transcriptional regulator for asnA, asnC and gidA